MNNYHNLRFYFYVFICFFAWCFYFSVDAKEVTLNVKSAEDLYDYENYYVSNFSKVQDGSVAYALPHLTIRTMNIGVNCGINSGNGECTFPKVDGNNQLFPSNDVQGADNWQINRLMPEAISEFHPDDPMQSLMHMTFRFGNDYSSGMKLDTEYQIGIKFRKDSNLSWGNPPRGDTINLDLNYIDDNDDVQNIDDSLIDKYSSWLWTDDDNIAILIITFKLDSTQHVYNFDNFYLREVDLNYVKSMRDSIVGNDLECYTITLTNGQRYNFNSGAGLISNSTAVPYYYRITNFYFIEDGYISFDDVAYDYEGNEIDTNDLEGYDSVEDNDLGIYESDEICGNADIICHLRNILKHIKNLFRKLTSGFLDLAKKITNGFASIILKIGDTAYYIIDSIITGISNFFRSLFIPDDEYFEYFLNGNYNFLRAKLGILIYPFELISNVLNRFMNLETNYVFSFSGFTLPVFNNQIIPSFTFNFYDFFNSNQQLFTLYNFYLIWVTAFLYIMFFLLCYKKFKSMIGGSGVL